jgi:hypothetical protein
MRVVKSGFFSVLLLAAVMAAALLTGGCSGNVSAPEPAPKSSGKEIVMAVGDGELSLPVENTTIRLYYHRPQDWQPGNPVFVMFHGEKRNAEALRDGLKAAADQHHVLLVCPLFDESHDGGSYGYALAGMAEREKGALRIRPERDWLFPVISDLAKAVRKAAGASQGLIVYCGHSAGAQMLHRYLLFGHPDPDIAYIVANAGWYTFPDEQVAFPYGLGNLPGEKGRGDRVFSLDVTLLLGEADTKRGASLRKSEAADRQGANRLERGQHFYEACRKRAEAAGVSFAWKLRTVPGVGHDAVRMGEAGMALIR